MKNKTIMNAQGTGRIWFRCMEKRADCKDCLAVSGWRGTPEEAWQEAAASTPEIKPFVEERLAHGSLSHTSVIRIRMNSNFLVEKEGEGKTYRYDRIWQIAWNSREAMIENGETDLPPAELGKEPMSLNFSLTRILLFIIGQDILSEIKKQRSFILSALKEEQEMLDEYTHNGKQQKNYFDNAQKKREKALADYQQEKTRHTRFVLKIIDLDCARSQMILISMEDKIAISKRQIIYWHRELDALNSKATTELWLRVVAISSILAAVKAFS